MASTVKKRHRALKTMDALCRQKGRIIEMSKTLHPDQIADRLRKDGLECAGWHVATVLAWWGIPCACDASWGSTWWKVKPKPLTPKSERPRCGAKTRSGRPCQAPAVWDYVNDCPRNGRCRMHGGLSTGPKRKKR